MAADHKNGRIRIGVIGTGQIGKRHLSNYQEIEDAEIVAVADLNEPEAQRVAALHNIPNVYTDYRELLKRDDIQAVDVCLHNVLHRPEDVPENANRSAARAAQRL